jgi:hypothetical protein
MTQAPTTGSMGTGKSDERVIYYRKPSNGGPEDGWIVWGDSESGTKLRDRAILGFTPMFKYGTITCYMDREQKIPDPGSVWGPILRHPDGPAEFPISQIVALRWHIDPPIKGMKFPQLAPPIKIIQYQCPECSRAPFAELRDGDKVILSAIKSMGNHLTIMHKWDRLALLKWGERVGIDFDAIDARVEIPYEYEAEPEVEDVVVETKTAEVASCHSCGGKIIGKLADHACQPVTA